jgi:hypothetical protein
VGCHASPNIEQIGSLVNLFSFAVAIYIYIWKHLRSRTEWQWLSLTNVPC